MSAKTDFIRRIGWCGFLAVIAPRYDVLPLIRRHFETRFADQHWIMYDSQRRYGIGRAGQRTHDIHLDCGPTKTAESIYENDHEALCQSLWQCYYHAVNIEHRNNPELHVGRLPRRYWPILPEKQS